MVGTWLGEISSRSCLAVLPDSAWVLLNKIYQPFFTSLYTGEECCCLLCPLFFSGSRDDNSEERKVRLLCSLRVGPFLDVVAGGNGTTREKGLEQVRKKIADTKYTNETLGERSRRDVRARGTNNGVKRPYSPPSSGEGGM